MASSTLDRCGGAAWCSATVTMPVAITYGETAPGKRRVLLL
jgi:hypothetical protein